MDGKGLKLRHPVVSKISELYGTFMSLLFFGIVFALSHWLVPRKTASAHVLVLVVSLVLPVNQVFLPRRPAPAVGVIVLLLPQLLHWVWKKLHQLQLHLVVATVYGATHDIVPPLPRHVAFGMKRNPSDAVPPLRNLPVCGVWILCILCLARTKRKVPLEGQNDISEAWKGALTKVGLHECHVMLRLWSKEFKERHSCPDI